MGNATFIRVIPELRLLQSGHCSHRRNLFGGANAPTASRAVASLIDFNRPNMSLLGDRGPRFRHKEKEHQHRDEGNGSDA
jgi:hypothetical protein